MSLGQSAESQTSEGIAFGTEKDFFRRAIAKAAGKLRETSYLINF
jgi:hypothetical protein